MSFSRHACRHALQPPATSLIDHVWISDDLLASAFKRFVKCQKRYESKVPGPLEARRRLAKRRNTALASVGNSGLPDMGSLFGKNGTGHMKWKSNERSFLFSQLDSLGETAIASTPDKRYKTDSSERVILLFSEPTRAAHAFFPRRGHCRCGRC